MRLLNTTTFKLEVFVDTGRDVPKYAILSHTWDVEEVLFRDMDQGITQEATKKAGMSKVKKSCAQAKADGYDYIWIDTMCIDKSSSAELSEAINFMFDWYAHSEVCYAFLADATHDNKKSFHDSRWFTRGWTLQELIAPAVVIFYDKDWHKIGDRVSLTDAIMSRTKIDKLTLSRQVAKMSNAEMIKSRLRTIGVSNKMSWVSWRNTTKIEDMAYCMIGIFDINMSLLYGEGERAFVRLQEEIVRTHQTDQSVLLWHGQTDTDYGQDVHGFQPIFAKQLSLFKSEPVRPLPGTWILQSLSLVNEGLRAHVLFCPLKYADAPELDANQGKATTSPGLPLYLAILHCSVNDDPVRRPCLLLYNVGEVLFGVGDAGKNQGLSGVFARATPEHFFIRPSTEFLDVTLPNKRRYYWICYAGL
jgi:hypothetical protein